MDLSAARTICHAMGGTFYDEQAVRWLAAMEQMLERLHPERFGHFAGVVNALENHVQEGDGDPNVVRHLGDAILALAATHRLEARTTKKLTQLLGQLHSHVAARAEQGPGR